MPDISIVQRPHAVDGDFALGALDIATGDDLKTAVLISLFTRRGWWADTYEADAIGSRLLELQRAKHSNETLLRARDYCRDALRWLIEDQVARAVDVRTAWVGSALVIEIAISQAVGIARFSFEWDAV